MTITAEDVYNSLKKNPLYSNDEIVKFGNTITVYTNIGVRKKEARKEKLLKIRDYLRDDLKNVYKSNLIIYNSKGGGSTIGRIEVTIGTRKDVYVLVKPPKEPQFLKTWRLNEEMFSDITAEYVDYAKDENSKLTLVITDGRKEVEIKNVISAVRVGGQNKKPDIKITTTDRSYNISLKMTPFASWHSYANNDSEVSRDATKILDNLTNIKAAFGAGSSGVSVISTIPEVKKFCYGEGSDSVDYIITSNITPKNFNYNNDTKVLTLTVSKIYEKNIIDYENIKKDCFLMIRAERGYSIGIKYTGYKITFVPKNIAINTLPGRR